MEKLSLITTCKGRLAHLRETLPLFCQLPDTRVFVVDYGCPERSGDWVQSCFPQVTVVRVTDDPGFNPSRARNIAARQAGSDYLFFVDADIRVKPEAYDAISAAAAPGTYVTVDSSADGDDIRGTCIIPRASFEKVQGYDEVLSSYGMEDTELYRRLSDNGLADAFIPADLFQAIPHGDDLRVRFFATKSLRKLRLTAKFYQEYVRVFRRSLGVPQVELDDREQIHRACAMLIDQLVTSSDPASGARIGMKLPRELLEGKVGSDMEWQFELTMTMRPRNTLAFRQRYQNALAFGR